MRVPEIFTESDYDEFSFADFNRGLVRSTIEKLKAEFGHEDNFKYFPIIVDRNMTVIDGQHRFQACKELNIPIFYLIKNKEVNPMDVRTVNKAGKRHTVSDIFEMECKSGNSEALKANRLSRELDGKFQLSALLALCFDTTSGGQVRDRLEAGRFIVKDYNNSKKIALKFLELTEQTTVSTTVYNSIASIASFNKIPVINLLSDLINKGLVINKKMSKTIMSNKIIETYNHRKSKSNRIEQP